MSNSSIVVDIVANETLIVEPTTTTTTTTLPPLTVENVTVVPSNNMTHCNITKLLFNNLISTVETKQPLSIFHSDLNALSFHLANYTNASNKPVIVMIQKLLSLLNSSITDCKRDKPVVIQPATETLNLTKPVIVNTTLNTTTNASMPHKNVTLHHILANITAVNITTTKNETNNSSNAAVDEKLENEKWNSMFKLIKFEYYRKEHKDEEKEDDDSYNHHDSDDDDDDDDHEEIAADDPENGHYYFYGKYYGKNDE